MFGHRVRLLHQFDLLDDAKPLQRSPARTHCGPFVEPRLGHLLWWERWSRITLVSRLAAASTLASLPAWRFRSRRFDDIARRRLRQGGGVLFQPGELGLQIRDPCIQRRNCLCDHLPHFVFTEQSCHATFITDSTPWRNSIFHHDRDRLRIFLGQFPPTKPKCSRARSHGCSTPPRRLQWRNCVARRSQMHLTGV